MAVLLFDHTGKRLYETGVDKGVLYPLNAGTASMIRGLPGTASQP